MSPGVVEPLSPLTNLALTRWCLRFLVFVLFVYYFSFTVHERACQLECLTLCNLFSIVMFIATTTTTTTTTIIIIIIIIIICTVNRLKRP